ncbi:MAG: hypothetical protein LC687_05980, partial [Actinobacteria bacterium]|nr:hypothetical protein [Actinomycetota bacterium]
MNQEQELLSQITTHSRYARFWAELGRREAYPEIVGRNRQMHIDHLDRLGIVGEAKNKIVGYIDFAYHYVEQQKVFPSMRSFQFGGEAIHRDNNRIYNCFAGETEFLTDKGVVDFAGTVGQTVNVLNGNGNFYPAEVKSFGHQPLSSVTLRYKGRSNLRKAVRATPGHRWILDDGSETTELRPGDRVLASASTPIEEGYDYLDGKVHGMVFADGSRQTQTPNRYATRLCGRKADALATFFHSPDYRSVSYPPSFSGDPVVTLVSDSTNYKELPVSGSSPDYIAGFIAGWLDFDGHQKASGTSF